MGAKDCFADTQKRFTLREEAARSQEKGQKQDASILGSNLKQSEALTEETRKAFQAKPFEVAAAPAAVSNSIFINPEQTNPTQSAHVETKIIEANSFKYEAAIYFSPTVLKKFNSFNVRSLPAEVADEKIVGILAQHEKSLGIAPQVGSSFVCQGQNAGQAEVNNCSGGGFVHQLNQGNPLRHPLDKLYAGVFYPKDREKYLNDGLPKLDQNLYSPEQHLKAVEHLAGYAVARDIVEFRSQWAALERSSNLTFLEKKIAAAHLATGFRGIRLAQAICKEKDPEHAAKLLQDGFLDKEPGEKVRAATCLYILRATTPEELTKRIEQATPVWFASKAKFGVVL